MMSEGGKFKCLILAVEITEIHQCAELKMIIGVCTDTHGI